MLSTQMRSQQPIFKDGVCFTYKDNAIEIRNRHHGFAITVEEETKESISQLLQLLQQGGLSTDGLIAACPKIGEEIPEMLSALTASGFIETKQYSTIAGRLTGRQFYRELHQFSLRFRKQFGVSNFFQQMSESRLSLNQLIGYVLESYHITHLCPRLLAPALANYESPSTQKLLQEFYVSELNHDVLIENSLKSVGITKEQLQGVQPLPMTFAICSALGVLARYDSLSFKAALMLFEEDDPQFHKLFKQQSQALGLPPEFYRPILLHAKINEDGSHENITQILLSEISYVSPEEQLAVKKNIANLIELMVLRTEEILNYYGNSQNVIPRYYC